MIRYSSNPALVRRTLWELLNAEGRRGVTSLGFSLFGIILTGLYAATLFAGFEQLSSLHKAMAIGVALLCLLFLASLISMYRAYSQKAGGLVTENSSTQVEIDLREDVVNVQLDGELTALPWASVGLVRKTTAVLILEFEGLCCLGVPTEAVPKEDLSLLEQKLVVNADNK